MIMRKKALIRHRHCGVDGRASARGRRRSSRVGVVVVGVDWNGWTVVECSGDSGESVRAGGGDKMWRRRWKWSSNNTFLAEETSRAGLAPPTALL
ncbi:hypothetical protein Mapa_006407 [Marchantia paleacea]|nr:hypothetical protein Mapa_006407 [Marchantia paleacea]